MLYILIALIVIGALLIIGMIFMTAFLLKNTVKADPTKKEDDLIKNNTEDGHIKDFFDINSKKESKVFSLDDGFDEDIHTVGADFFEKIEKSMDMNNKSIQKLAENYAEKDDKDEFINEFETVSIEEVTQNGFDEATTVNMSEHKSKGNKKGIEVVFKYKDGDTNKIVKMLTQQIAVGRGIDNDLMLGKGTFTSRNHAIFYIKDNKVYLKDLNSKNGTFIGSKRITDDVCIENSCEVIFGDTAVSVEITKQE